MAGNIAFNKPADANGSMYPYTPAKAVDGVSTPLSRWVGSSPLPPEPATPAPNWLRVDLGAFYWINRWVVRQMGSLGWSTSYNLTDYKLQGSLDNVNWFDIDTVTNNSANSTDRPTNPTKTRWIRIYITKGLRCNTNFASVADLEIYPADPTSAKLSALSINPGTLEQQFGSTTYVYTAKVGYDNSSVAVTATTEDSRATIKVNGSPVTSGQPFTVGNLAVGPDTITAQVTPYIGEPQNYTITVTRSSSPYLSGLAIAGLRGGGISPSFSKTNYDYTSIVPNTTSSISIIPTAEDSSNATITVNGSVVQSGQQSQAISLNVGLNAVSIMVTSTTGTDYKTYTIIVTRTT